MLLIILLSFCTTIRLSHVESFTGNSNKKWQQFKEKYQKAYIDQHRATEAERNYLDNIVEINKHNSDYAAGKATYTMAVYPFSDLPYESALDMLSGTELPSETGIAFTALSTLTDIAVDVLFPAGPVSKDWRSICLPVVDQKKCGSCWSFAAIAQVESLYNRKYPSLNIPLSQQYLLDCSRPENRSCSGGWPKTAMDYLKENGCVPDVYYPYKAVQEDCRPASKLTLLPIIKETFEYKLNGNETRLKNIVAKDGPVAVAFYTSKSFMQYKSGIFEDDTCPTDCSKLNHAMLVVGYGTDKTFKPPKDYWLIRNSWGPTWGDGGYVKVIRNAGKSCLTACYAMYTK